MEGLGLEGSDAAGMEAVLLLSQPANAAAKAAVNTTFFIHESRAHSTSRDNSFRKPRLAKFPLPAEEGGMRECR